MRLIDADAAVVRISKIVKNDWLMYEIKETVKKIPTADVREHKTGKWIWDGEGFHCSECFFRAYGDTHLCLDGTFRYCPRCGAKMGGE